MQTPPPVTPYLTVSDAAAAIEFYKAAFGAVETDRHLAPGSDKIMHARLDINGGVIMLSDDFSSMMGGHSETPQALGGSPITLALQLAEVDPVWASALAAGATVTMPLGDMFWGDRYGQLKDPFGHKWSLSQTLKVMSPEELEQGAKAAFKPGNEPAQDPVSP